MSQKLSTKLNEDSVYFKILIVNVLNIQSIMVGVVGFWGGTFAMGSVYLLMVLAKRVFHPEEAEKSPA